MQRGRKRNSFSNIGEGSGEVCRQAWCGTLGLCWFAHSVLVPKDRHRALATTLQVGCRTVQDSAGGGRVLGVTFPFTRGGQGAALRARCAVGRGVKLRIVHWIFSDGGPWSVDVWPSRMLACCSLLSLYRPEETTIPVSIIFLIRMLCESGYAPSPPSSAPWSPRQQCVGADGWQPSAASPWFAACVLPILLSMPSHRSSLQR